MSGDGDRFPVSSSSDCPFSLHYHHRLQRKLLNGEINWPTMWLFLYIWFPSLLSCPPQMPPIPWTGVDPFTSVMAPNATNTLTGVGPFTPSWLLNATNTLDLHAIFLHGHADTTTPDYAPGVWMNQVRSFRLSLLNYKENKKKHKNRIAKENKLSIW